jgi:hypothetical protein
MQSAAMALITNVTGQPSNGTAQHLALRDHYGNHSEGVAGSKQRSAQVSIGIVLQI